MRSGILPDLIVNFGRRPIEDTFCGAATVFGGRRVASEYTRPSCTFTRSNRSSLGSSPWTNSAPQITKKPSKSVQGDLQN